MKESASKNIKKEPWQIAAARYCVANSELGFDQPGLNEYIKSSYAVSEAHLHQFWEEEIYLPTGRKYSRNARGNWMPPLDLVSKVTDYDELKEARKNARQAFWLSIIAIIISATTLIVPFLDNFNHLQIQGFSIFVQLLIRCIFA